MLHRVMRHLSTHSTRTQLLTRCRLFLYTHLTYMYVHSCKHDNLTPRLCLHARNNSTLQVKGQMSNYCTHRRRDWGRGYIVYMYNHHYLTYTHTPSPYEHPSCASSCFVTACTPCKYNYMYILVIPNYMYMYMGCTM